MIIPTNIKPFLSAIQKLDPQSHKGQNGKVLLIGGSELFHAASRWSLDVLSAMVDMVFYSSVPENNALIHEAKREFWDGVVVPRGEVESYIGEASVILIGPGMTRSNRQFSINNFQFSAPTPEQWENDTEVIVNYLLSKYQQKKWVIDAGALQMLDPKLLNQRCIITPHHEELERVRAKLQNPLETGVTILLKGHEDTVMQDDKVEKIAGGNPGMTKGGTGDVLAGLVAGLYCFSDDRFAIACVASYVNKLAGDELYSVYGPFFKTAQLVDQIPRVLKKLLY